MAKNIMAENFDANEPFVVWNELNNSVAMPYIDDEELVAYGKHILKKFPFRIRYSIRNKRYEIALNFNDNTWQKKVIVFSVNDENKKLREKLYLGNFNESSLDCFVKTTFLL